MDTPHVLRLARAGNPKAIAHLINQALSAQDLRAHAALQGHCLHLMLEGGQVPNEQILIPYLKNSLQKLNAADIRTVQIQGRQRLATAPAWSQTLSLTPVSTEATPTIEATPTVPTGEISAPVTAESPSGRSHPPLTSRSVSSKPANYLSGQQVAFVTLVSLLMMFVGANLRTVSDLALRQVSRTPSLAKASLNYTGIYRAPVIERMGGIPVINVTFNGNQTFPMMLDTGASGTLITPEMAQLLQVEPTAQVRTATVNGIVLLDMGYVSSMEVQGAKVLDVAVAVGLPDMDIGLLGQDFFQYFDITLREDMVEFEPRRPR
ncbi:retropepsin-like aspartic protease family protein [Leptolyngbya sp. AN02str]|uniref:retropepsin-like aspartic protease family protein n=1 Tax=Leptolyngbya sp. AN02str TaxID=3423363 RepID=UPI003D30F222